ncbi:MAG: acetyl-CoA carboxylase biotin carboxylase subunit [Saprospiraceae bacterium]|nr:acetyl-CoA carboxylase biotin carboxylase subunit [Saprospiraceae bacterium]
MKRVLIANRGEIACRVIRTLRKLGIESVAVYSDADKKALHTLEADIAVHVGASASSDSYLNQKKIIEIAKKFQVDAIHPGYGFLSENPVFALALEKAGIKLIGPSARSMEIMGNKLAAKDAVKAFGIPMVPGTESALINTEEAIAVGNQIGYPILIKAAAGGGGKGMRIVDKKENIAEQVQLAINEATSAFGDGSVFIEKYITKPRHIEIQVLADQHGNVLYLFERECSIQRRHQKVVEEAPSSVLTPEIRKAMGEAAVMVAKACNYEGAGTVEFLLDENLNFYFLEMNTRLQVEHPVTEMITGIDLVEQQIKIARGEILNIKQEDLSINGHSIELRIYAEDPYDNFMPSIGLLNKYRIPEGDGVRVDNGISEGMQIPVFYDPMLAKLAVHGHTRESAIQKMKMAIGDYEIEGIVSTLDFGAFVMSHPDFISGNFDTNFVNKNWNEEGIKQLYNEQAQAASEIAQFLLNESDENLVVINHNR